MSAIFLNLSKPIFSSAGPSALPCNSLLNQMVAEAEQDAAKQLRKDGKKGIRPQIMAKMEQFERKISNDIDPKHSENFKKYLREEHPEVEESKSVDQVCESHVDESLAVDGSDSVYEEKTERHIMRGSAKIY